MEKTESKAETLNRLFKENGLLKEDWFEHSQYRIITRTGIEKIQYKNTVEVDFEAITMTPSFCVVKATAVKRLGQTQRIQVQTFGSAGFPADGSVPKNKEKQYLYYPEMAEKRALSRAILKVCGFYELGVFGEDESEDFKQPREAKTEASTPANSLKKSDKIAEASAASAQTMTAAPATPENPHPIRIDQKTAILLKLNVKCFTQAKKDKMIARFPTMSADLADSAIYRLNTIIKERGLETGESASGKQVELIEKYLKSSVFSEEERKPILADIATGKYLKSDASAAIEYLERELKARKEAKAA